MMVKQYFYKVGNLPIQNIGTGNIEMQKFIEEHIEANTVESFPGSLTDRPKTIFLLSKGMEEDDFNIEG